jgi:nitrogen-specific signal transduction histidine kinase
LSAGLAHEIRNPLGVIKGSAEMLTQKLGESNPLATELAGYISTETNRLSALVTRFLDFARPMHTELAAGDVTAVMERALNTVALVRKDAPVRVEKEYEANLPTVPLDESLAEQAFVNIVQNAYDAMGENGGTVRILLARARVGRDGIEVRVEDSGPGVPADLREQIFNPFVTTKKTGVGLGLSIVSKIMDGHHGSIRVENTAGSTGARFVMFFPKAREAQLAQPASQLVGA